MRKFFAFLAVAALVASAATAFAKVDPRNAISNVNQGPRLGLANDDAPIAQPGFTRGDTLNFGFYQDISGTKYAVLGETWTWDHGAPDPLEGWVAIDETEAPGDYFRWINATNWAAGGNAVAAPILNGTGSAWVGLFENDADALCWLGGLGYGNNWCQKLTKTVTYDGSGDVTITFRYFQDTELNFDYTKLVVDPAGAAPEVIINGDGFTDKIGLAEPNPPTGADYSRVITEAELGGAGARQVEIFFRFESDGGWSDEDAQYTTMYGPFGVDNINLVNNLSSGGGLTDFESGLGTWTAQRCAGIGTFFGIAPLENYIIQDPCQCELAGNVLEFHDANQEHPVGQMVAAKSPKVRKQLQAPYPAYNKIFADWDQYAEMPQANGVMYRPQWEFYPYICPETGVTMWSPITGQDSWHYVGDQPACYLTRSIATDWGISPDCEFVGFVYEMVSSCDMFGIGNCTGVTNFTPIIDNVQIRFTGVPVAPVVTFETGGMFQDNFNPGANLNVLQPTNVDITYDLHRDPSGNEADKPDLLGDSLIITGPVPTVDTRYYTRLWFRVRREGPGQKHIANYRTWLTAVSDGRNIVGANGQFTFGWMDSIQVGTNAYRNKFCSQFHEDDDDFAGTNNEQAEVNEIIRDDILTPGTKIEYFVTSNYTCTPNINYLLPDTAGKFYREIEILPSFRNVSPEGLYRYPCVLYVDAYNVGGQYYIENALNVVLNGAAVNDPIPDPTTWDRYDYLDATSNWCAPMFRNGGNAGGNVAQYLGYKFILVSTGTHPLSTMRSRDWQGFSDWLTATQCFGGGQPRQGFWVGGDNVVEMINNPDPLYGLPSFLNRLGAANDCDTYWADDCPSGETQNDENYCVRLADVAGVAYDQTELLDLFGNWCPPQYSYQSMIPLNTSGAAANKKYQNVATNYVSPNAAQVTYDQSTTPNNYRSVLDGYSIDHVIRRHAPIGDPTVNGECAFDTVNVVQGSLAEVREVLKWTLGISDPLALGLCSDPCLNTTDVDGGSFQIGNGLVDRLYQNTPNPFNPRTTINFSLARSGPAKLVIFDVNGREVRTLVNGKLNAGLHSYVWDGTDDNGRPVSSGVFWSQLVAGDYSSNRKMVVLK